MKNRLLPFIFTVFLAVTSLTAQVCETYEGSYEEQKQKYPAFYQNLESLNAELAADYKSALSKMTHLKTENGKKIIPVVVHVIYDAAAGSENLSISQIQDGLDALNTNINGQAYNFFGGTFMGDQGSRDVDTTPDIFASVRGDLNVEFRLAKLDPLGKPTSGIVRVRSELTNLPEPHDQVKALSYWNSYQYFNIWTITKFADSPTQTGYAQFPFTNMQDWNGDGMSTDGVVLKASRLAEGKTITHEAGHWLGLCHTWSCSASGSAIPPPCGSDKIQDTPQDSRGNHDFDGTFPFNVGDCNGLVGKAGEMYMNYMDYQDAIYSTMFTKGQNVVMNETLDGKYDSETDETGIGFREYMWSVDNVAATGVADGYLMPICTQKPDFEIKSVSSSICEGDGIGLQGNKTLFGNDDVTNLSNVTAMHWDFGDGNDSTFIDPTGLTGSSGNQLSYIYAAEGVFDVSLIVEYNETTEARSSSLSDLDLSNASSYDSIVKTVNEQGTESELIAMGATNILLHLDGTPDTLSPHSLWKYNIPADSAVGAHSASEIGPDIFQLIFSAKPGDSLEIEDYERLALCDVGTWEVDSIDNNTGEPLIFYYGEYSGIAWDAYFMDTLFYRGEAEQTTYIAYYTNTCIDTTVKENFISVASTSSANDIGSGIIYGFEDAADLSADAADLSVDWHITTNIVDGDWGFNPRQNSSWEWIDGVARSGDAALIFNKDNETPRIGFGHDELISAAYDLSAFSNPAIKFSWSGAAVNTFFDNVLIVSYSDDCGKLWHELGKLESYTTTYGRRANGQIVSLGQSLVVDTVTLIGAANAGLYTTSFKPEANEWNDTIMSKAELINDNIKFKFDYVTSSLLEDHPHGSANNFYIDNIQIGETSALFMPVISASKLSIYPNPTNGQVVIRLDDLADMNVEVKLVNILGAEVRNLFEGEIVSNYYVLDNIDLSALETGIYFVKVVANGNVVTTNKLILSK